MTTPRAIDLDTLLDEFGNEVRKGHGTPPVGPSDSSDTGADSDTSDDGEDSASDRNGTGERMSADADDDVQPGADVGADRIVTAREAGLGGGLDQAEEAQLGITDEELDAAVREKLGLDLD